MQAQVVFEERVFMALQDRPESRYYMHDEIDKGIKELFPEYDQLAHRMYHYLLKIQAQTGEVW